MAVSIGAVHLTVDDPDATLGLYRDALGFGVVNDVENAGSGWVTLSSETQPEVRLVLSQPHGGRSPDGGDAMARLLATGELNPVHLRTVDLEATFEQVVDVPGVEIVQEPNDRFWGVRDAGIRTRRATCYGSNRPDRRPDPSRSPAARAVDHNRRSRR